MSGFVLPLLLHFHTTKVRQFFHIRKKNNDYFSKKCTFLCIFLAVGKSPAFHTLHIRTYNNKTTTWTPEHITHTTDTQDKEKENTKQCNEYLNKWTQCTAHTVDTMDKVDSGHIGQGKENTRQRNEDMHRHTHRRRHTHKRKHMCMYNK